jgi:hypothetical protein
MLKQIGHTAIDRGADAGALESQPRAVQIGLRLWQAGWVLKALLA